MAVQQARVPVLDAGGRFPDAYAPPSVAADTQAAQDAREGAESARADAVTARGQAEVARQGAETALAGVPSAVEGAVGPQVQAATDAASAAQASAEAAAGSAEAAAQTADSRIAAGLSSGGVIKAADDATLSAAKSYADSGVAQVNTWFLRGNGSPVGVVTPSSAGVQYVDLAVTNGARVWISTGTTWSAWRVVDGNTGWRDVKAYVNSAQLTAIDTLMLLRHGDVARLRISGAASVSGAAFYLLPVGFAAKGNTGFPMFGLSANNYLGVYTGIWLSGALTLPSVLAQEVSWGTSQPWPTTLPGTPA